jgi:hypothetical protein
MKIADLKHINWETRVKMIVWCHEFLGNGMTWSANPTVNRIVFWEDSEYEMFLLKWS